jgi:hypothetical protein
MPTTIRRSTALTAAGIALCAAFATGPAAFASAPAAVPGPTTGPHAVSSGDWAGYAVTDGTYTSVSANWVQPSVTCTGAPTFYTSTWVGLDGYNDSALEQTGTEADCVNGTPEYGAWWEVLPASESPYSVTVRPGDHLSASVVYNGDGSFTMTLSNTTEGWTKSTRHAGSSGFQNSSAEVISQATSVGGQIGTVGSGYSVTFQDCEANGTSFAELNPVQIVPGDRSGIITPLTSTGNFTVTWGDGDTLKPRAAESTAGSPRTIA